MLAARPSYRRTADFLCNAIDELHILMRRRTETPVSAQQERINTVYNNASATGIPCSFPKTIEGGSRQLWTVTNRRCHVCIKTVLYLCIQERGWGVCVRRGDSYRFGVELFYSFACWMLLWAREHAFNR